MLHSSKRPMFDSSAVFFVASFDLNATAAFGQRPFALEHGLQSARMMSDLQ